MSGSSFGSMILRDFQLHTTDELIVTVKDWTSQDDYSESWSRRKLQGWFGNVISLLFQIYTGASLGSGPVVSIWFLPKGKRTLLWTRLVLSSFRQVSLVVKKLSRHWSLWGFTLFLSLATDFMVFKWILLTRAVPTGFLRKFIKRICE